MTDDKRAQISEEIQGFSIRPLVSVVMPTYNSPEPYLRAAIESVRGQLYPNWELCIADDASTQPHVRQVLQRYTNEDARI